MFFLNVRDLHQFTGNIEQINLMAWLTTPSIPSLTDASFCSHTLVTKPATALNVRFTPEKNVS